MAFHPVRQLFRIFSIGLNTLLLLGVVVIILMSVQPSFSESMVNLAEETGFFGSGGTAVDETASDVAVSHTGQTGEQTDTQLAMSGETNDTQVAPRTPPATVENQGSLLYDGAIFAAVMKPESAGVTVVTEGAIVAVSTAFLRVATAGGEETVRLSAAVPVYFKHHPHQGSVELYQMPRSSIEAGWQVREYAQAGETEFLVVEE